MSGRATSVERLSANALDLSTSASISCSGQGRSARTDATISCIVAAVERLCGPRQHGLAGKDRPPRGAQAGRERIAGRGLRPPRLGAPFRYRAPGTGPARARADAEWAGHIGVLVAILPPGARRVLRRANTRSGSPYVRQEE